MSSAAGTMPVDPQRLRQLLGCFPTGVAIITTTTADGQPAGLTCNSFSSVSLEPPLVLFSLRKQSRLLEVFRASQGFAINILTQQQDALSGRFASSRIEDKFAGVAWKPGALGLPLIEHCLASFECSVFARHDAGDHDLFIGEVRHMASGSPEPALVFYKGAYMALAESLRKHVLEGKVTADDVDESYRTLYGTLLRLACARATPAEIDAVEAAVLDIERHQGEQALPQRIEAQARFFGAIAAAGHNEALRLMAETMIKVLRERMVHVIPPHPKPGAFPLRRAIVQALRARDADAAVTAFEHMVAVMRRELQLSDARPPAQAAMA